MRTALLVVVGLMALPALAAAQGGAGPDLKLTTLDGSGDQNKPTGEAPRKELDVSKMMFDAESVRQVVNFYQPNIQACYEKALADTGEKFQGKVMVSFVVDPHGNVTDAKLNAKKSTLRNDRVTDCVLIEVRRWLFPKANDNRDHPIEYPFEFKFVK